MGFGLRIPLKDCGDRPAIGVFPAGLKLKILGSTTAFFSSGVAGCRTSSQRAEADQYVDVGSTAQPMLPSAKMVMPA
jgi:hypothetical protein